jgi:hypothetical protein
LLSCVILYAPYLWLLFVHDSWTYRLTWLKMWPMLPGLVVAFSGEAVVWPLAWHFAVGVFPGSGLPRYAPHLREMLPAWGVLTLQIGITAFHLVAFWLILTRFRRWRWPVGIAAGGYSLVLGFLAYCIFAA